MGHRVGRDVSLYQRCGIVCAHSHACTGTHTRARAHARTVGTVCEETQRARSQRRVVVVGCSPPRVERETRGMLVHQGGGWLIDRTRFSTRPAEPRHSFHPESADPLGRTCSPSGNQPKDHRERKTKGGRVQRKRASRRNRYVSKGRRSTRSLPRAVSLTLDSVAENIEIKIDSEI